MSVAPGRERLLAMLASRLDQTVLKPAPEASVIASYRRAAADGCKAFVTHAVYLPGLKKEVFKCTPALSAVIDFPFGLSPAATKLRLIGEAARLGAGELELVINMRDAAEARYAAIERELARLEKASRGLVRKVIIETAYRDDRSLERLGRLVAASGCEYIKTSTGYAPKGAEARQVRILRGLLEGSGCGLKASGGIGSLARCLAMIRAGAGRIGTSRGAEILREASVAWRDAGRRASAAAIMSIRGGEDG